MYLYQSTTRRKRQSKGVTSEAVGEEDSVNNGKSNILYNEIYNLHDCLDLMTAITLSWSLIVAEGQLDTVSSNELMGEKEEVAPTESTEVKRGEEANQDEQGIANASK